MYGVKRASSKDLNERTSPRHGCSPSILTVTRVRNPRFS